MIEINMTVYYDKWTGDFSTYNIQTFQKCAYDIPETYVEMYLFIEEIVIPPGKRNIYSSNFWHRKNAVKLNDFIRRIHPGESLFFCLG